MVLPPADRSGQAPPAGATTAAPYDPALQAGLTPAQLEAVTAPERALCVLAGAGAGKTRVLTLRVARRIHDGSAEVQHVLVCTFSRKAADELRRRLWTLRVGGDVRAGTFHRTALHLLRQHRSDRGLPPPKVLPDRRAVLEAMLEGVARDGGDLSGRAAPQRGGRRAREVAPYATGRARKPGPVSGAQGPARGRRSVSIAQLETEIGWAKARLVTPAGYEEAARQERRRPSMGAGRVAELYARYEEVNRRNGLVDLDDLLWSCADMLEGDPRFAAAVRWRFRHVFVDEMQDVNAAQFRLLRSLLGEDPDLFVVGDPNQSVYGWNGADPTLLDRLPAVFPAIRVVRLEENHRSSPQVVAVAAAVLGLPGHGTPTSTRPDGPVPRIANHVTDQDEAAWVAKEVWLAHRPRRRWSQIAVLARTNAQLLPLADALRAQRVPFRLAGGDLGPASDVHLGVGERQEAAGRRSGPRADKLQSEGGTFGGDNGQSDHGDETGHEDAARAGSQVDEASDAVVLTTFHRAKGLQWPAVFVVGLSDGIVPISSARTPAARDEERRLLYVALTRAEDDLSCTWATYRDALAQESGAAPRRPSPWLEEMARTRTTLEAAAAPPDRSGVAAHLADIRARLRTDDPTPG